MLFSLATAPVIIALFYIYIRDKYEKEPWALLAVSLVFGIVITGPIIFVANMTLLFLPQNFGMLGEAFFNSFVVSSFVEETFKYIVLFFLTWKSKDLNEKFDGIVYGVFISLGFAFVENILYVFSDDLGGISTAFSRGAISVPGHGLFGVYMGYFFTCAKWTGKHFRQTKRNKSKFLILAFFVPIFIHGFYNLFLLTDVSIYVFIAYVALVYFGAARMLKLHQEASPFKSPYVKM